MIYSMLGAVGPRAAAAPVALSLGKGGSHLWSSRQHGSNLRGLLRFQEHATSSWTNSPKSNSTKSKRSPERLLVEFVFFFILFESNVKIACFVIHFSTNQMRIKSNDFFFGEVS